MGGNVSTNASKTIQQTKNVMKSSCNPSTTISQTLKDNVVVLRGDAKCNTVSFKNTARAKSSCDMENVSKTLAKQAEKLTEEQKAGIGINISNDFSANVQTIENILEKHCGAKADIEQEMSGNRIEIWDQAQCEALEFMNEADATSTCVMKQVNDVIADLTVETARTQKGFGADLGDPTVSFMSSTCSCVCSCILLILVLIGGFIYMQTMMP